MCTCSDFPLRPTHRYSDTQRGGELGAAAAGVDTKYLLNQPNIYIPFPNFTEIFVNNVTGHALIICIWYMFIVTDERESTCCVCVVMCEPHHVFTKGAASENLKDNMCPGLPTSPAPCLDVGNVVAWVMYYN